ncbi:hypothetical protein BST61_g6753 [Cercospora zeina]
MLCSAASIHFKRFEEAAHRRGGRESLQESCWIGADMFRHGLDHRYITSMIFASHFFSNRTKSAQLPRHETLSAIKAGNSQVPTSAGSD